MDFSFVFAAGRMRLDGRQRTADGSLVHLRLPRGPDLRDALAARLDGDEVTVPVIDVLGVIHNLHEQGGWQASGAAAQIVAGRSDLFTATDHERLRERLRELMVGPDWGTLETQVQDTGQRRRWHVAILDHSGKKPLKPKTFTSADAARAWYPEAERIGRRRMLSTRTGWAQKRLTELLDEGSRFGLTEVLELADVLERSPSALLSDA
jgi:hypothetical protein